jgi:hypothetical protein
MYDEQASKIRQWHDPCQWCRPINCHPQLMSQDKSGRYQNSIQKEERNSMNRADSLRRHP